MLEIWFIVFIQFAHLYIICWQMCVTDFKVKTSLCLVLLMLQMLTGGAEVTKNNFLRTVRRTGFACSYGNQAGGGWEGVLQVIAFFRSFSRCWFSYIPLQNGSSFVRTLFFLSQWEWKPLWKDHLSDQFCPEFLPSFCEDFCAFDKHLC